MAVANAVLDVLLADGFLGGVTRTGQHLRDELEALSGRHRDVIEEVRGRGLLLGLKLTQAVPNAQFAERARDLGLLMVPAADNVVRILPPLIIGAAEVEEGIAMLAARLGAKVDPLSPSL